MKKLLVVLIFVSVLAVIPIFGQETQETRETEAVQEALEVEEAKEVNQVQETQVQPKEIEINKGFFTSFKYNDGKTTRKLNLGDLEKIVVSINDEEATRYFIKSKTLQNTSLGFGMVGGFLIGWSIGGAISGDGFNTPLCLVGGGITSVGLVIALFSQNERVKSVERYNSVIKDQWGINFQYAPENSEFGFKLGYSF